MKPTIPMLCLCLIAFLSGANAQRFPINNVSQEQAVQIASRLWVGMSEDTVEKVVEKENDLKTGGSLGSPISSWTRFYVLTNVCSLHLKIEPKQPGTNSWLRAASITTMKGETVVSITLTNAPKLKRK